MTRVIHKSVKEYSVIKELTKDLHQVLKTSKNGINLILFNTKDSGYPCCYVFDKQ